MNRLKHIALIVGAVALVALPVLGSSLTFWPSAGLICTLVAAALSSVPYLKNFDPEKNSRLAYVLHVSGIVVTVVGGVAAALATTLPAGSRTAVIAGFAAALAGNLKAAFAAKQNA